MSLKFSSTQVANIVNEKSGLRQQYDLHERVTAQEIRDSGEVSSRSGQNIDLRNMDQADLGRMLFQIAMERERKEEVERKADEEEERKEEERRRTLEYLTDLDATAPTCQNRHTMVLSTFSGHTGSINYRTGHTCDGCSRSGSRTTERWFCFDCGIDYCLQCGDQMAARKEERRQARLAIDADRERTEALRRQQVEARMPRWESGRFPDAERQEERRRARLAVDADRKEERRRARLAADADLAAANASLAAMSLGLDCLKCYTCDDELEPYRWQHGGTCDGCDEETYDGQMMMHCHRCNWGLCASCQ